MPDVNILIHAHRSGSEYHRRYADWLKALVGSGQPFALSEMVMQSLIRIVTNPRSFRPASTVEEAFAFLDAMVALPNCHLLRPGPRHLAIFRQLCASPGIRANLVADAAHAALAIEHGCTWCSADTDFKRFEPLLRWEHI